MYSCDCGKQNHDCSDAFNDPEHKENGEGHVESSRDVDPSVRVIEVRCMYRAIASVPCFYVEQENACWD